MKNYHSATSTEQPNQFNNPTILNSKGNAIKHPTAFPQL